MEKIHLTFLSQFVTKVGPEPGTPNSGFDILLINHIVPIAFGLGNTTLS